MRYYWDRDIPSTDTYAPSLSQLPIRHNRISSTSQLPKSRRRANEADSEFCSPNACRIAWYEKGTRPDRARDAAEFSFLRYVVLIIVQ
jgi:hypothetical protein